MNILNRSMKPATRQPVALSAKSPSIDLPSEMRAAMDAVTASLDARRAVDEAIARNLAEQAQAEAECEQAAEALTELDVAAALATDPVAIKSMPAQVEGARRRHDEAAQKVARIGRLKVALAQKAREADDRLRGDRTLFQIEAQAHAQRLIAELGLELREAAKPLVAVLLKLHGATYGLGIGRAMVGLLEEVSIPSAIYGEQPIVKGSRFTDDDGKSVDLAQAWQDAPEAAALASAMQPYADLRRRLAAHQDYRDPPPPPKVQAETSRRNREAIARERQIEIENERLRAEAEAARPRAVPRTWTETRGVY